VMEAAQTANVYDIVERFDKVIDPVAHTFTQVEDFIGYFKASLQYEVIRKKAKAKGQTGRAWRKAYDSLRASISRGKRLSLALIEPAIKLAEAHLREGSPVKEERTASKATTEDCETKRGFHAAKKDHKKIKELEAKLAKATGTSAPTSPAKGRQPTTASTTPRGPGPGGAREGTARAVGGG